MVYKLEPNELLLKKPTPHCPYCKSTETYISHFKDSRYCNNCDRTYNSLSKGNPKNYSLEFENIH